MSREKSGAYIIQGKFINIRQGKGALVPTATVSSKGQITIPVSVRNELKLGPGDRVEYVQIAPGRYEMITENADVTDLKGMFSVAKKFVSIETMVQAIATRGASNA